MGSGEHGDSEAGQAEVSPVGDDPVPGAAVPEVVMSAERRRELTIDTMASWALSGMEPSRETVEHINEFLESGLTAGEWIRKLGLRAEGGGDAGQVATQPPTV